MAEVVNVLSEQEALSRGIGDWMLGLIRKLVEIDHTRGWGTFSLYREKAPVPEKPNGFAFITWDAEVAKLAKSSLDEAGLLCDHELENPPPYRYHVQEEFRQVKPTILKFQREAHGKTVRAMYLSGYAVYTAFTDDSLLVVQHCEDGDGEYSMRVRTAPFLEPYTLKVLGFWSEEAYDAYQKDQVRKHAEADEKRDRETYERLRAKFESARLPDDPK
jgi:hypothetical protein